MYVKCRKVGAIGMFYWTHFPNAYTKTGWFAMYGNNWELWCFNKYTPT